MISASESDSSTERHFCNEPCHECARRRNDKEGVAMAYRLIGDIMKKKEKGGPVSSSKAGVGRHDYGVRIFLFVSGMTCNRLETDPKTHGKSVEGPYSNICLLMKKFGDGQVLSIGLMNPGGKAFGVLARFRLNWL